MKPQQFTITTLGSHSALQILKGAKDEGFSTICIALAEKEKPYQMFPVADKIIAISFYQEFLLIDKKLAHKNIILIPDASLIAYLKEEKITKLKMKYFGNKKIIE